MIKALLEKYWQTETTVEEEKTLATYFRGPGIDPDLEPFRELFAYFEEEGKVTPGEDFESRILERIHQADAAPVVPIRPVRRWLNTSYAAAAAVILSIGLFLMYQPTHPIAGPATANAPHASPALLGSAAPSGVFSIKDTYEDPQQALAAIRQALMTASARMNQGKKITQKNMDRLKKLNYGQL
jgi:hypothetical protein